jgi:hypothetical protein
LWAFFNLVAAYFLVVKVGTFDVINPGHILTLALGAFLLAFLRQSILANFTVAAGFTAAFGLLCLLQLFLLVAASRFPVNPDEKFSG